MEIITNAIFAKSIEIWNLEIATSDDVVMAKRNTSVARLVYEVVGSKQRVKNKWLYSV